MLTIFMYAFGVMFTPGPVNTIAIAQGLSGRFWQSLGFFCGVGTAMIFLFSLISVAGAAMVHQGVLPFVAAGGCLYTLYLAGKIWSASRSEESGVTGEPQKQIRALGFKDGLLLQILNPKAFIAGLPICTVQFPAAGLTLNEMLLYSVILGIMAGSAPTTYACLGHILGKRIASKSAFRKINQGLALLLVYVAFVMGYEGIYIPVILG